MNTTCHYFSYTADFFHLAFTFGPIHFAATSDFGSSAHDTATNNTSHNNNHNYGFSRVGWPYTLNLLQWIENPLCRGSQSSNFFKPTMLCLIYFLHLLNRRKISTTSRTYALWKLWACSEWQLYYVRYVWACVCVHVFLLLVLKA